jgi:hypothetical protein
MEKLTITLEERHVEMCKRFASFRRTLTTSYRLIENMGQNDNEDLVDTNLEELLQIIPTIEAL